MSRRPTAEMYRRRRRAVALLAVLVLSLVVVAGYLFPRDAQGEQADAAPAESTTNAPAAPAATPAAPASPDAKTKVQAELEQELAAHKASDYDSGHMNDTFREQLNQAVAAAKKDGVKVTLLSGYRSYAHQERLYREQVAKTGSIEEARKLVLPPWQSMHVRGGAIDVDKKFAAWLLKHGNRYGLCQRYANEWWHYELLAFPGAPCPAQDPTPAEGNVGG